MATFKFIWGTDKMANDEAAELEPEESIVNLHDLERAAASRLDPQVYDYFAGGSEDEVAVRANRMAWQSLFVRNRVLTGIRDVDTSATLLGANLRYPIVVAPTGHHGLAHPDGEIATAQGTASAGALMTVSTLSTFSMEAIGSAAPSGWRWFQLYTHRNRRETSRLVERAYASGYRAIVLTVDLPVFSIRDRDVRSRFSVPAELRPGNFDRKIERVAQLSLGWKDLTWIMRASPLPLLLKGVVRADDAKRAVDAGVGGIWVSNHGGRALGNSIPTAVALSEVVSAVDGSVPIIVDGGIRRGSDVLAALVLGASAVALGRPPIWALSVGGANAVHRAISMLGEEFRAALGLAGCRSVDEISKDLIVDPKRMPTGDWVAAGLARASRAPESEEPPR